MLVNKEVKIFQLLISQKASQLFLKMGFTFKQTYTTPTKNQLMKNLKKTYRNRTFTPKNEGNTLQKVTPSASNHSVSDHIFQPDFIPHEAKTDSNNLSQVARKEYFESLISEFKNKWDNQLIAGFYEFNFGFHKMIADLETYLSTHSIYSNAKKYCATLYKFEVKFPFVSLERTYANFEELKGSFEEKNSYTLKIKTKSGDHISIKLYEGFIQNHPEGISLGRSSKYPSI